MFLQQTEGKHKQYLVHNHTNNKRKSIKINSVFEPFFNVSQHLTVSKECSKLYSKQFSVATLFTNMEQFEMGKRNGPSSP